MQTGRPVSVQPTKTIPGSFPLQNGFVDISEVARKAGFHCPFMVSRRVWEDVITPDDTARMYGQTESARLWDLMESFRNEALKGRVDKMSFALIVMSGQRRPKLVLLKSHLKEQTDGRRGIVITLPDEN
ncbi:MAG TPA: hypothetical protein DCE14_00135 [Kosmotogaceae bacterium]|nr:MAG: Uncharacterized protein XE05_1539 [Thermotogales bacterium 46_20]HAA84754.1 hypothetical protein [Kosmotogaceae bacterium]